MMRLRMACQRLVSSKCAVALIREHGGNQPPTPEFSGSFIIAVILTHLTRRRVSAFLGGRKEYFVPDKVGSDDDQLWMRSRTYATRWTPNAPCCRPARISHSNPQLLLWSM